MVAFISQVAVTDRLFFLLTAEGRTQAGASYRDDPFHSLSSSALCSQAVPVTQQLLQHHLPLSCSAYSMKCSICPLLWLLPGPGSRADLRTAQWKRPGCSAPLTFGARRTALPFFPAPQIDHPCCFPYTEFVPNYSRADEKRGISKPVIVTGQINIKSLGIS